jgi:hypothetical protein
VVGNRKRSSDNAPLWRAEAGSGTQGTSETPAITLSQAYFIAGRLVTSASGNDQLQFTAYGPADTMPASEPGSFLVNSVPAMLTGTITGISLSGSDTASPSGFDEIRIGDTWDAVTAPIAYQPFADWAAASGIPAATGDSDLNLNGIPDGIEYVTGASGSGATRDLLPQLVIAEDVPNEFLSLYLTYNPGAADFSLVVEESEDLQNWRPIWDSSKPDALNHPLILQVQSSGATQTLWIRASRPLHPAPPINRGFLRLGIRD